MGEHALLSASSAHRWLKCSPSVRLEEEVEDSTSIYAKEGTFMHGLAELHLKLFLDDITKSEFNKRLKEMKQNDFYTDEIEKAVEIYVDAVIEKIIVADFSAIEARVIAWLAGEKWRMDVFNSHGKIYEASASQMFGVPVEEIHKGSVLRQKGKIAELALGYGGSKGALKAMGAIDMGLSEEELPELVSAWRKSNSNIVRLWWDVESAAIKAVKDRTIVSMQYGLKFYFKSGVLFIRLPSGRSLAYVRPRIEIDERFNKDKLTYEGMEGMKWGRIDTYGGKLTENIIQAIARDCLAESMLRLEKYGYRIVFHVHDEVILDVPKDNGSLEEVEEIKVGEKLIM